MSQPEHISGPLKDALAEVERAMDGFFDDDDPDEFDKDEADFEDAIQECGQTDDGDAAGCSLAGTEYCEFRCPFRDTEDQDEEPQHPF